MNKNHYHDTVRRAALPEILFAHDIELALELPRGLAEAAAREDRFGAHLLVGGRVAVLRKDFLEALGRLAEEADKDVLR